VNQLPAAASASLLPHGPQAHRRDGRRRIRRSDLYSCRLGVVFVARFCPTLASSLATRVLALNKLASDPVQLRHPRLWLESDLRARFPCGVAVAATVIPLWTLSSGSAVVAARVPASLRRLGGAAQERGWRLMSFPALLSANSRRWSIRCLVCGRRWAAPSVSVDCVDWIRRCGDPDELGVFPGRRSPKLASSSFAAGANRGPQSRLTARKLLRVLVCWIFVFVSGAIFGGGLGSRVAGDVRRSPRGLFVISYFLRVVCVKYRVALAFSRVFWVQRVVSCNFSYA
jgi:hypothetical protein